MVKVQVQCPDCCGYHEVSDKEIEALKQEAVDNAFNALRDLVEEHWKELVRGDEKDE